jgi:hypothetical protein
LQAPPAGHNWRDRAETGRCLGRSRGFRDRPVADLAAPMAMGKDAPHLPFAIPAGIGSVGWIADLPQSQGRYAQDPVKI